MADTDKNINQLTTLGTSDIEDASNKIYATKTAGGEDGALVITEYTEYILDQVPESTSLWQIITNKLSNILQSVDYLSLFAKSVEVVRIGDGVNPKVIVDPAGTLDNTTGIWFSDADTGFYEALANQIWWAFGGNVKLKMSSSYLTGASFTQFAINIATGYSSTVPKYTTLGDENTGLGSAGADQLSLISGGVEAIRNTPTGTEIKVIKSGATQVAAGANVDEMWKTLGHATLPDNVIMHGV